MPGPPPPSKSYLLTFDTDSDDDSSNEGRESYNHNRTIIPALRASSTSASNSSASASVSVSDTSNNTSNINASNINNSNSINDDHDIPKGNNESLHRLLQNLTSSTTATTPTSKNYTTTATATKATTTTKTTKTTKTETNEDKIITTKEEEKQEKKSKKDIETTTTITTNTTEKKKRKKKRKKKKKSNPKHVQFNNITVYEHIREMGGQGVPSDGGWPLSLSNKLHSTLQLPIDEFETRKQVELKVRYQSFIIAQRHKVMNTKSSHEDDHHRHHPTQQHSKRRTRSNSFHNTKESKKSHKHTEIDESRNKMLESMSVYTEPDFIFETRQMDQRKKGYLDFKYRIHHDSANMTISNTNTSTSTSTSTLVDSNEHQSEEEILKQMEWETVQHSGRNVLFAPLREDERQKALIRDHPDSIHKDQSQPQKRHHEYDLYDDTTVRHVRNELEKIRIERSKHDSSGCSCRKMHVYIPNYDPLHQNPHNNSKKHHHRRLTERRVKEELRKRHISIPPPKSNSRIELEKLLYHTVAEEGCCYGNDCECFRNGIGCQMDTCSCWQVSHSGGATLHSRKSTIPPKKEILANCGNKNGCYIVDFDEIHKIRSQFIGPLESGVCADCN